VIIGYTPKVINENELLGVVSVGLYMDGCY